MAASLCMRLMALKKVTPRNRWMPYAVGRKSTEPRLSLTGRFSKAV
jgi:hypothetical protein